MSVRKIIVLLILNLLLSSALLSQNLAIPITKSTEVQIYGGKEYFIHIVRSGHTLYSLSKIYEIPIDEISFENPEIKNGLFVSQILRIPVKSRDEAIKSAIRSKNFDFFYHIAKVNERFNEIASIYSISRRDLQYANPGLYDPLKEGQYVKVPVVVDTKEKQQISREQKRIEKPKEKKESNPYNIHTVTAGDNLYQLAIKYGCSTDDIKRINPGLSNIIHLNQRILIPKIESNQQFISHTVQRRERLAKIARNYDVKVEAIKNLNPFIKDRPYAGQKVKIPIDFKPLTNPIILEEEVFMVEESINQDSIECFNDVSNLTKEYHIALMIPFYLEDVDSLKFNENTDADEFIKERPFRYMQFYYGALMAIDSLKKQGLNIDLNVYDVDGELSKTIKVFNDNAELQEMDLIIGPFFSNSFAVASKFALLFDIPIVNPLSTRSNILDNNPYVYKFQPTNKFHQDEIRNLVSTYFTDAKIFFVKRQNIGFDRTFRPYIDQISELLIEDFSLANDDLYELLIDKSMVDTTLVEDLIPYIMIEGDTVDLDYLEFNLGDSTTFQNKISEFYYSRDSIKYFEQFASTTRQNVVFTITDNNVFALDVMTQLNILRDSFPTTVVGLPNWVDFDNMDNEILLNLNVHTLNFTHIDYSNPRLKDFVFDYRKKHLTEPTNYAFTAFDISWYFLNAIMNFGTKFSSCLPYFKPDLIQSKVDFYRKDAKSGMENRGLQIVKYQNYQIRKVLTFPPPDLNEFEDQY